VRMNQAICDKTPVYFFHSIEGIIDSQRELTTMIDKPVIGVQRSRDVCIDSVEQLASDYIQRFMKDHPVGQPIDLVGYSYGGCVAFEAGCQLQKHGYTVNSLILLDSSPLYVSAHTASHAGKDDIDETALILIGYLMQYIDFDYKEVLEGLILETSDQSKINKAVHILKETTGTETPIDELKESAWMFMNFLNIGRRYKPSERFDGNITLIKPTNLRKMAENLAEDYGVSQCISNGEVHVHSVEGRHETFICGDSAVLCAKIIQKVF